MLRVPILLYRPLLPIAFSPLYPPLPIDSRQDVEQTPLERCLVECLISGDRVFWLSECNICKAF